MNRLGGLAWCGAVAHWVRWGLFTVFKFLSPQDLVAAAKASRCLARASNTPALWRHLFLLRWGEKSTVETGSEMEAYASWKKLYFERDSEEMDRLPRHGDAVMGDIYLKMHISQRAKVRCRVLPPPPLVHDSSEEI